MCETLPSPTAKLTVTLDGAVATVAIDNPGKRNALDLEMWSALPSIMAALGSHGRVRAVVLRGAGTGAFASGADIAEFATVRADAAGGRHYERENEAAFWAVARCPKPVIAMIRGYCLGGGLGLALACDLRVAEDGAVFGIPAARLGAGYPPGAMGLLVAALGVAAAKDLLFTARRIGAAEAQQLGIVQRVVGDAELESTVQSLALTIAANAPLTILAAKAAIHEAAGLAPSLEAPDLASGGATKNQDAEGGAAALADACFDSADYREGVRAFLDKRPPRFEGR
jgi:enoyl-CoA hydratase/carnithine racemase